MSRAWDKEKIWVPDRIWTYDLPNTGRAICSGNSSILSSLGGQYTWSSKTTLLFALNFACSLFLSLLSWEGTYLQDNLSLWHYKILLLNPSTLSGHKKGLKKPFILSWKTLKPPTHSLMGKSYYYLFYKYDFFTKKKLRGILFKKLHDYRNWSFLFCPFFIVQRKWGKPNWVSLSTEQKWIACSIHNIDNKRNSPKPGLNPF